MMKLIEMMWLAMSTMIEVTVGEYKEWRGFLGALINPGTGISSHRDIVVVWICPPPYTAPLTDICLPLAWLKKLVPQTK